jgi:iron complex transport system substrate-binding protein
MRIVSLLPSATEILFAIGAGDDVVGVTHECDYPPEALALPRVTSSALTAQPTSAAIDRHVRAHLHFGSSLYHLDAKMLVNLDPDLIVTQELCEVCAVSYALVDRAARRLRSDPRIVSLEPSSLDDVFSTIAFLGDLTGRAQNGKSVVAELRAQVGALRQRAQRSQRPRTLVLEWTNPPMSAGHWTPELVELAGGKPVLANPGADSQRLEWDAILQADPDAVVVVPCGFDLARTQEAIAELDGIAQWNALRARREGHVFAMDGNAYVSRPGPRLVESARIIADALARVPSR